MLAAAFCEIVLCLTLKATCSPLPPPNSMVISESPVAISEEKAQLRLRFREPPHSYDAERVTKSQVETGFPRRQCHTRFYHGFTPLRTRPQDGKFTRDGTFITVRKLSPRPAT
jgi:hypothetical protein